MKIQCDGFEFDFTDAVDVIIFDEKNNANPNFHGLSHAMKAVDLVVEFTDYYLFVEVKDIYEPEKYGDKDALNHLRDILKHKFRDSWLYRWCEGRLDKPIKYLCLLEHLGVGTLSSMSKELRRQLPTGICGPRWGQGLSSGCYVLNLEMWNHSNSKWPVTRLPTS